MSREYLAGKAFPRDTRKTFYSARLYYLIQHGGVDSPNTYHTLLECQVIIWCYLEELEEAKDGRCNMEFVVGSEELDKTRFREALLE